jgi:hypothetical protein
VKLTCDSLQEKEIKKKRGERRKKLTCDSLQEKEIKKKRGERRKLRREERKRGISLTLNNLQCSCFSRNFCL